jgi:hypothetical protein
VELEPSRSKSMAPFCSTTNLFEPLTLALKVSHPRIALMKHGAGCLPADDGVRNVCSGASYAP